MCRRTTGRRCRRRSLLGEIDDTTLPFDFAAHAVEVRLGERIESLDALAADAVVLAVGSQPIALPGARTLRTAADALALRAQMTAGARVIVVGAGWIGAEVATAAAKHGCQVEVFEALSAPLAAALPEEIGRRTVPWFEEAGIALHLGVRVGAVEQLDADLVVAGVGVRPDTRWLEGVLDLEESGGVVVDEQLRASLPGVWAVGDCAAWFSPRYQRRLRVEHWDIALARPIRGRRLGARRERRRRRSVEITTRARPRRRSTTRCRTSGPTSSGAAWRMPAGTRRPRRWCSAVTRRATRPGRCCG